jgi:ferredoxin-thioredoxin reductase catalytic subunit
MGIIKMDKHEKIKKMIYESSKKYADKKGYKLNPDKEMLDIIIDGLAKNQEKYGKRYCPCRILTDDEEENKKIICPCVFHEEEIELNGMCHCALFFKGKK